MGKALRAIWREIYVEHPWMGWGAFLAVAGTLGMYAGQVLS